MREFWRRWRQQIGLRGRPGRCTVTAVAVGVSRQQVEDFLYAEAALLDAWSLDDWLLLFDEDAKYEVPCNDAPDGDPEHRPAAHRRRLRAAAGTGGTAQQPPRPPRIPALAHPPPDRQCQGVPLDEDGEIGVTASFTVWRFHGDKTSCYVGRYRYRLRVSTNGFRIASKRAELDMTELRAVWDVAIIL